MPLACWPLGCVPCESIVAINGIDTICDVWCHSLLLFYFSSIAYRSQYQEHIPSDWHDVDFIISKVIQERKIVWFM